MDKPLSIDSHKLMSKRISLQILYEDFHAVIFVKLVNLRDIYSTNGIVFNFPNFELWLYKSHKYSNSPDSKYYHKDKNGYNWIGKRIVLVSQHCSHA